MKHNRRTTTARQALRMVSMALAFSALAGCQLFTRLSEVGQPPTLAEINNPVAAPNYRPVTMPMPAPKLVEDNPNSLWRAGAKAFFRDHRAKEVGDILTVRLALDDSATLANTTERDRQDSEDNDLNDLLGFEDHLDAIFPESIDSPGQIGNFSTVHSTEGDGSITRSEEVNLEFAAIITQILPNGNLVIMGRQEVRVNAELRELLVTGIVRTSDIDTDNTIDHTKIAEMRVGYGGRGSLSDLQQPRWGMQIWDIIFPF